ncbi:hypothetical protein Tco_0577892 [Tanacetum coccineum]
MLIHQSGVICQDMYCMCTPTQATPTNAQKQQHQLYQTMKDNHQLQQDDLPIWLALKYNFERLCIVATPCRPSTARPRDQDDPHEDAHPEGENSAKRQKTTEHETFELGGSSSGQDYESELGPSTSGNQEQSDDFDFWTNSYAIDDDESKKEILVLLYQPKPTPVVQSCQRDLKAHALSLVNQYLLYLKKGNTRPEKITLSLQKFPAVRFPDNDIEERTSRWVTKCVKKFNPYARYVSITESDYKNLNKNDIKDMYLLIVNHKVDDYAGTRLLWSLSVFIKSTVIWERVHDFQLGVESYQQQVNLNAPTITFLDIEKYKVFSVVSKPLFGIIYKNNKKEKRVMRHQEVHTFCDATLKIVLEGLKSYNNDVKYGYVTHNLSKEDAEYLQLFAEEIEEWLKYYDQVRRWEMYVNGRPLGSRRERPK